MRHLVTTILVFLSLNTWLVSSHSVARADSDAEPYVHLLTSSDGVRLEWDAALNTSGTQALALSDLPLVQIGGVRIPAYVVALRMPRLPHLTIRAQASVPVSIDYLEDIPWDGFVESADMPIPQTLAGVLRPDLATIAERNIPATPVVVLREGLLRGERIAVVALSPLFSRDGEMRLATRLQATIAGAVLLADDDATLHNLAAHLSNSAPFLDAIVSPDNPYASWSAFKVSVTQAGIQRISGSTLAAAGMNLATIEPARLRLWRQGTEVALEEQGTEDGQLDPGDELRFYALSPGDRWNESDIYWLIVDTDAGLRMPVQEAASTSAPVRTTASEPGNWRNNILYDSQLPGSDGDHWFATEVYTAPFSIPITPTLPLAQGTLAITLTGSAYITGEHQLVARIGTTEGRATWYGTGNWTQIFTFTITDTSGVPQLQIYAPAETGASGVLLDSVHWEQPVTLNMAGQGAMFTSIAGHWAYQLTQVSSERDLYDVSQFHIPTHITLPTGSSVVLTLEQGPGLYVLAGAGTLHSPTVTAHAPVNLVATLNADVVYIAPAAFQSTLEPLVAYRQVQGHRATVVDVQAIYDAWSWGRVSPDAIRSFLRYAAATWNPAPTAVILVGDGTSDPHNYTRLNNQTGIPPYLAMVDPWLGETACDTCYAQLDGADPLDDTLPDVAIGRLPVKSSSELETLVAKLVGYETDGGGVWRSRAVYIADNARDAAGVLDPAGDFASMSDAIVALLPQDMTVERVYYDPSPTHVGIPWREPDALRAHQSTFDSLNAGASLVTYTGHGHLWQWAVTDPQADVPYLLGLYDVDDLTNGERLPIVLSMTCLTSAFQQPAFSGTTIDERLVLHSGGGAVAVWGSTGLGITYGHDMLQYGFYRVLQDTATPTATLGLATMAGYTEIFTRGYCCQDAVRTFVLLGDPLTRINLSPTWDVYLPAIVKD